MKEPEFTLEGYPTMGTLQEIEYWDPSDPHGLAMFVQAAWKWGTKMAPLIRGYEVHDWFIDMVRQTSGMDATGNLVMWLSTGGWSGNEDIVIALRRNLAFHGKYWVLDKAGGEHVYILPEKPKETKNVDSNSNSGVNSCSCCDNDEREKREGSGPDEAAGVLLAPCCACGAKAVNQRSYVVLIFWGICAKVSCNNCGISGPVRKTKREAAESWNRLRYMK